MALSMALGGGTLGIMMNEDFEGRVFFFASWAICVTDTSLFTTGFYFCFILVQLFSIFIHCHVCIPIALSLERRFAKTGWQFNVICDVKC